MFHRNWRRVDGRLIDSRIIDFQSANSAHRHECVVEFAGVDGAKVRVKAVASVVVSLPGNGGIVPLLVKPDDSEAVFDKDDPRINVNAIYKASKQAERERLDRQLHGGDD